MSVGLWERRGEESLKAVNSNQTFLKNTRGFFGGVGGGWGGWLVFLGFFFFVPASAQTSFSWPARREGGEGGGEGRERIAKL